MFCHKRKRNYGFHSTLSVFDIPERLGTLLLNTTVFPTPISASRLLGQMSFSPFGGCIGDAGESHVVILTKTPLLPLNLLLDFIIKLHPLLLLHLSVYSFTAYSIYW